MKGRVKKIGIELEGGWSYRPQGLKADKSLRRLSSPYIGEVASPPMEDLSSVLRWIDKFYPQEVNSSCGLHIHISLDNLNYSRLMEYEFYSYFRENIQLWSRKAVRPSDLNFWNRLNGANYYCRDGFRPLEQVRERSKTPARYTALNYCYALHGTLECRLFPMFRDIETAKSAVRAFIDIVESYLNRDDVKLNRPFTFSVNEPDLDFRLSIHKTRDGIEIYCRSEILEAMFSSMAVREELCSFMKYPFYWIRPMSNGIWADISLDYWRKLPDSFPFIYGEPVLSFVRAKGLSKGIKLRVEGLFTDDVLSEYIDKVKRYILLSLRERYGKELESVCNNRLRKVEA